MNRHFYWNEDESGILMGFKDAECFPEVMECLIAPRYGANLCRFSVEGLNIIDFEKDLLITAGYTGTPVLYPTPNRVRNGIFKWNGKEYPQVKRDVHVFEHGLVHNETWQYTEPLIGDSCISLSVWIDFKEGCSCFEAFPFPHSLNLEFTLEQKGVRITYSIENKGAESLPFGFGLHPYFMKLSGEEDTFVTLPARYIMEADADLLPSGRLIEVEDTFFDLRKPVPIGELNFDHVFTGISVGEYAQIEYGRQNLAVILESSEEFTHLVLYSPRGEQYFCLESQTCSTDAHNLYYNGFKEQSGLKTLEPFSTFKGQVFYRVVKGGEHED